MNIRKLGILLALFCGLATGSLPVLANTSIAQLPSSYNQVSIATQLTEIQRGTFDGRDYLTIHIGGHHVGPSSCRSNILRINSNSNTSTERQSAIETIALSAMLSSETVMVVIPLDISQCVDGKPTFTDLYLLSASH